MQICKFSNQFVLVPSQAVLRGGGCAGVYLHASVAVSSQPASHPSGNLELGIVLLSTWEMLVLRTVEGPNRLTCINSNFEVSPCWTSPAHPLMAQMDLGSLQILVLIGVLRLPVVAVCQPDAG